MFFDFFTLNENYEKREMKQKKKSANNKEIIM